MTINFNSGSVFSALQREEVDLKQMITAFKKLETDFGDTSGNGPETHRPPDQEGTNNPTGNGGGHGDTGNNHVLNPQEILALCGGDPEDGAAPTSSHHPISSGKGSPTGTKDNDPGNTNSPTGTNSGTVTNNGTPVKNSGINLSPYGQLQLPTGSKGSVDSVNGSSLSSYKGEAFQRQPNGSIVMNVPKGSSGITEGSTNPRSELAEENTWKMSSGQSTQTGTLSVNQSPQGGVVFAQIHQRVAAGNTPRPLVELRYENGNVYASIMTKQTQGSEHSSRQDVKIASGIKPGEQFSYSLGVGPGGKLNISVNHSEDGEPKTSNYSTNLDHSLLNANCYFKAGNYPQNPDGGSQVTYDALNISH